MKLLKIYGDIKLNKNYTEQDLNKILTNLYSTNFLKMLKLELSNGILKLLK